jgi:hypothetical protein
VYCQHCAAGHFAAAAGASKCSPCSKGRFGIDAIGATSEDVHCLHCPAGKFQEADGMLQCSDCVSGQYTHASFEKTGCRSCTELAVDSARVYSTRGLAGQSKCWKVPLDCAPGAWSAYSTCTKSCGTGKKQRKRSALRQPAGGACGVGGQLCSASWGGGKACSEFAWQAIAPCNEHACPVDCSLNAWGAWSGCTRTCGSGSATRVRNINVATEYGGKTCSHLRETQKCNDHKCGWHLMPTCHARHVRCKVERVNHPNSPDERALPRCALSDVDPEGKPCTWDGINCTHPDEMSEENCHRADTLGEKAMNTRLQLQFEACKRGEHAIRHQARAFNGLHPRHEHCTTSFDTVVVTHDHHFFNMQGGFKCQRDGHDGCSCLCNKHPPCCEKPKTRALGLAIFGNAGLGVSTRQECCNLCTNHPQCTSWQLDDGGCTLQAGSAQFAGGAAGTWAGKPWDASDGNVCSWGAASSRRRRVITGDPASRRRRNRSGALASP